MCGHTRPHHRFAHAGPVERHTDARAESVESACQSDGKWTGCVPHRSCRWRFSVASFAARHADAAAFPNGDPNVIPHNDDVSIAFRHRVDCGLDSHAPAADGNPSASAAFAYRQAGADGDARAHPDTCTDDLAGHGHGLGQRSEPAAG